MIEIKHDKMSEATHQELLKAAVELRLMAEETVGDQKIACRWASKILVDMVECEDEVDMIGNWIKEEGIHGPMKALITLLRGDDIDEGQELREEVFKRLKDIEAKRVNGEVPNAA